MSQVGEQDVGELTGKTAFAACFETQTTFVGAKLLYLRSTAVIVHSKEELFGGEREATDIVAVQILPFVQSFFDKDAHGATIVDGGRDFAQPSIGAQGIPAFDLLRQGDGPPIAQPFGDDMVATP